MRVPRLSSNWFTPGHYQQPHKMRNIVLESGVAPAPFNPLTDDPDLVAFYHAPSESLYVDNDAVSTVTNHFGGAVANGTQSGSNRGIYKTGIQNGHSVFRVAAASSQYWNVIGGIAAWETNLPLSVITVHNLTDKGVGSQFHLLSCIATNTANGGGKVPFAVAAVESNATFGDYWTCFPTASTTGVASTPGQLTGGWMITGVSYDGSGVSTAAAYEHRKDNAAQTETATGTGSTGTSNAHLCAWVGAGSPSLYANGDFGTWVFRTSTLSSTMWTNYATYLGDFWDIPQSAMFAMANHQEEKPKAIVRGWSFDEVKRAS